jgi:hypothetical protein
MCFELWFKRSIKGEMNTSELERERLSGLIAQVGNISYKSQESSVRMATAYELYDGGLFSGRGEEFLFLSMSRAHLGPAYPPMRNAPGVLSPKARRPGREDGHSLPSSVDITNDGATPLHPHTSSWHGAQLIKHRYNFAFHYL